MTDKEEFIKIYTENITRDGADKLLDFLENKSKTANVLKQFCVGNEFIGLSLFTGTHCIGSELVD